MSYVSSTIGRVLDDINRSYFLPAIQRPYVWQPEQIVALFDSLLKGYPISSFLFWEIRPERRADWEIYKFIENFRHGDTHNEMAEPDGRDVKLVLDGQQRLTSLLIGLRGTYSVRARYGRRHNPNAWSRQRLYLDLLKDLRSTTRYPTTRTSASPTAFASSRRSRRVTHGTTGSRSGASSTASATMPLIA